MIKPNLAQKFILIFTLSVTIFSCTKEEVISQDFGSKEVITEEMKLEFQKLLNDPELLNKFKNNYQKSIDQNRDPETEVISVEDFDLNGALQDYIDCDSCDPDYKEFIVPLFQEIADVEDLEVITIIEKYENKVIDFSTSIEIKKNLSALLFIFKNTTKLAIEQSSNKGPGKSIGRGLVGGFLSGCAAGAYTGAVAGTVTVPVIGTVAGAVSGCIAAGAVGAVYGALFGALWGAADEILQ